MLQITDLHISISDQGIVKGLTLEVKPGSLHAIMGQNGSGKSTLANTLMGNPAYCVTQGSITLSGNDITHLSPDKRAKAGLFLAFQHPLVLQGVTVSSFLKEAYHAITGSVVSVQEFQIVLKQAMDVLGMDHAFAQRNVNEGFSGGEKKRLEMLQLLILKPRVAILDEIDSGLDIDALKAVTEALQQARKANPDMSVIIITHYQRILQYIIPDSVHIMHEGVLVRSGTAHLAHQLEQHGYQKMMHGPEHA